MDGNHESRNPRSGSSNTLTYTVTIYRTNSETSVCYERVKHCWWAGPIFVVSQLRTTDSPMHDYWEWPAAQIDHVHIEKVV
jgi:hypothetical protein